MHTYQVSTPSNNIATGSNIIVTTTTTIIMVTTTTIIIRCILSLSQAF